MFAELLVVACLAGHPPVAALPPARAAARAAAAVVAESADDKALKALAAWLKLYRAGKAPLRAKGAWQPVPIDNKDSFAVKFGLAPKSGLGTPTWASDLDLILEHVVKLDTPEAARALLEVASVGYDQGDYTREMAPFEVRGAAEKWLKKLVAQPARDEVARAARGEVETDKARAVAVQAAAVRCVALLREPAARPILEQQLRHPDLVVRAHAAEGLGALGDEAAAPALIAALEAEPSDAVLPAVAQALRALYAKHLPKPGNPAAKGEPPADPPASLRLAVRAAAVALGRTTWRADLALVDLLDDFRSTETLPALIAVLERFRDHPEQVQSGRLSGLLLHRVHELLVAMTGAVFPANQPDKWRELWEREKDRITVAPVGKPGGPATTTAGSFFGIPVQGTRVLFILDVSGSMKFPMQQTGTTAGGKAAPSDKTRLDFARRELLRAMEALSPHAQFNLITFNGDAKARAWSKDLVPATEKARERFRKYVAELEALGGTNLWSALEQGLKMKSLVYGDRYESNVDEVFVLSDGAPTVGDVVDPIEILRLVKECNRFAKLRINTVYISSPDPRDMPPMPWMTITPEELMQRMADQNGGRFVNL